MRTIRTKLFVMFSVFMIALISLGVVLNALFLEDYYIFKNKSLMIALESQIESEYKRNREGIDKYINQLDRMEGVSCLITDSQWIVRFNSVPQRMTLEEMRLPSEIDQLLRENEDKLNSGQPLYKVIEKPQDQAAKLMFVKKTENGDLIILRKALKGIQESVAIANQFYWIAGFLLILIGALFLAFFSKAITRPLKDMSVVADEIAHQNFSKRVLYTSSDELGQLGESINQMSEKLSESMDSLRQDVDRRKELVRNVSHELKSPIGVIKGYAEGLAFGVAKDPDKTERYCKVIADECDRMDKLVRELLELSMLESGQRPLKRERFSLTEMVSHCARRYEAQLNQAQIVLQLEMEQDFDIEGDRDLIERMVNNYIENAIHHIGGERKIQVQVKRLSSMEFELSVSNTGEGLSAVELTKIWDVFYKVDQSRARVYGGHGLGLSIVKEIAELHGGSVGAKNTEDGISFCFKIPMKPSA